MAQESLIERIIAAISPRMAAERASWRQAHDLVKGQRNYAGADRGRLSADWRTTSSSADLEIWRDLATLRNRSRDLVRNNPYAAAAVRGLASDLVGNGVKAKATHRVKSVEKKAQEIWDAWANSQVDGFNQFAQIQLLAVRAMIEGGDALLIWQPDRGIPDAMVHVVEGDFLDSTKTIKLNDGRIVSGVETDENGRRRAYWVLNDHPGDILGGFSVSTDGSAVGNLGNGFSRRLDARDVDHIFRADRPGQTRGAPWLASVIRKLRNIEQLEESIQAKKRVEACLALIRETPDADANNPLIGDVETQSDGTNWETISPGMVVTTLPGEKVSVVNPSSISDGDAFHRAQLMAVSAGIGIPYHRITNDVSQANYSSLRAATVAYWADLDTDLGQVIIPHLCEPAFTRVMRRAALQTGDKRLLEVKATWTPPARAWVDPLKDITAEVLEIRAGLASMPGALSQRGTNYRDHYAEIAAANDLADKLGLALQTDPRRVNDKGALQPATGYLAPSGEQPQPVQGE